MFIIISCKFTYIYTHKIYKSICGYSCFVHSFFNATYFFLRIIPVFLFYMDFPNETTKKSDALYECSIVIRRRRPLPKDGKKAVPLDVSNIIRGGPRKAKFKCELGRNGEHAMSSLVKEDLDFAVIDATIPLSFLEKVDTDTEWVVQNGEFGTLAKIRRLKKTVQQKDSEIEEMEQCLELATTSIKNFHAQQKQLYQDFVTLRDKYDLNKKRLRDILWGRVATLTREFSILPQIQDKAYETENEIEQYRLGKTLGSGEFAIVRAATVSEEIGSVRRKIAIKIVHKERVTTILGLQRAVNEIRILREASHPNILILFDVIQTRAYLYLVVERGHKDLFDYIDGMQKLDKPVLENTTKSLMKQLLAGVDYLHDMNVCHRDIKPENLLIIEGADDVMKLKILDFGMCANTGGGTTLTEKAGTPGFMAPEMIYGQGYDGFLADMWSVGCVFLELVLGHHLFEQVWMPPYDTKNFNTPDVFLEKVTNMIPMARSAVKGRMKMKLLNGAGEDLLFQILELDPTKRRGAQDAYTHRWVGGKPRAGATGNLTLRRTRRTRSTNDLRTLDALDRRSPLEFPHETDQKKRDAEKRKKKIIQKDSEGLLNINHIIGSKTMENIEADAEEMKEVNVMKTPTKQIRRPPGINTDINAFQGGRRKPFLPPVEPLTPSIAGAKVFVDEGSKMVMTAEQNNATKRIRTPMSPMSPSPKKK